MIIDKLLSPAIGKALSTFTVTTQVIGEIMDWGADRNQGLLAKPYGPGYSLLALGADSAADTATLNLQLVTDSDSTLGSAVVLWSSGVKTVANLAEYMEFVPIPDTDLWERYVAWRAVVGTQVFTAGTLSIEYVGDKRRWRGYPAQGNQ